MEKLLEYKIMPRLMMAVMTIMYIRCIEWALTQPDLSTQQSALISVVAGAMTGAFVALLSRCHRARCSPAVAARLSRASRIAAPVTRT